MFNRFVLSAIVLAIATPALAGPFGLEMGEPISKYKYTAGEQKFQYILRDVPTPFANADFYSVLATPETGICKVSLLTKTLDNDAYGEKVKEEYSSLKDALTAKYGIPGSSYDFLRSGSIWKDDRDFAMSLKVDERTLASYWPEPSQPAAGNVTAVGVEARAVSGSGTYSVVRYEFKNAKRCLEIIKAADTNGL